MAMQQKTKDRIQTILIVLLGIVVLYALITGQISFGGNGGDEPQGGNDPAAVDPGDDNGGAGQGGQDEGPHSGIFDEFGQELPVGAEKAVDGGTTVYKGGYYYAKDTVALYIHTWGELPPNFLTKKAAKALGWENGSLEPYMPGGAIGGSNFGNNEGLLPKAKGRSWFECDINTLGSKTRGAERILFSSDGLIFYTDDHYESFVQLY